MVTVKKNITFILKDRKMLCKKCAEKYK
jgi:hypothetical protein